MLLVVGDEAGSASFVDLPTATVKLRVDSRFLYYLPLRYLISYATAISLSFADHRPFLVSGQYGAHVSFLACLPPAVCSLPSATWLLFADLKVFEASNSPIAPVDHNQRNTEHARRFLRNEVSIDTKQTESHAPVHWRLGDISLYLACSWRMGLSMRR